MPQPLKQPAYRLHKARDCAVVTLNGKNHYLGPWQSPESHEKYARLIAEWRANRNHLLPTTAAGPVADRTLSIARSPRDSPARRRAAPVSPLTAPG